MATSQSKLIDVGGLSQLNKALGSTARNLKAGGVTVSGFTVTENGIEETQQQLGDIVAQLRKQMFREIGSMVKKRVTTAKDKMPSRSGRMVKETFLTKAGSKKSQAVGGGSRKQGLFGFQAVSAAPHATILDLMENAATPRTEAQLKTLIRDYGSAPRFLGGQFLPSGEGGTEMWRESKSIIERYTEEFQKIMDANASKRMVS